MLKWFTNAAEKVTGWLEIIGWFTSAETQDTINKGENITDVVKATTDALSDGFQWHDITDVAKTGAGAYVDQTLTEKTRNFLSSFFLTKWLPDFIIQAISSWVGNLSQEMVESVVDTVGDAVIGDTREQKVNNLDKLVPEEIRNQDLNGNGKRGTDMEEANTATPTYVPNAAIVANQSKAQLATTH